MSAKPTKRNWNDVQTAIAAATIVTTLGMWNLFAAPGKTVTTQTEDPTLPPTEPPTATEPASMPYVKIMFTPAPGTQTTTVAQQPQQPSPQKKKKHRTSAPAAPITQTKSS